MLKFALILAVALFGTSATDTSKNIKTLPSIEFSQSAIDFESGQPVFTDETKAILKTANLEDVRVVINDQVDLITNSDKIEISSLIELSEGTYTVLLQGKDYEETFGFTIR
ncbi:hypothetical protein [Ekhidna sp.]|uniref:hypothetical protein n=1 Tax=Ekhidna sp. TaxID=2608089 RepID=UPI003CCBFD59